jgi:hypothetical protein
MPNIFYNSHHSPVGAFASFTLGFKGASGGLGIELAGPACQNVYIGIESAAAPGQFFALPFYDAGERGRSVEAEPTAQDVWGDSDRAVADADGGGEHPRGQRRQPGPAPQKAATITPFADGDIARETTPACDVWRAGGLEFRIYTPSLSLPDPSRSAEQVAQDPSALKDAAIPAVFVEITLDNTGCASPRKAFFGYEGNDPYSAMRRVAGERVNGVGQGRVTGIFTDDMDVACALAFSAEELLAGDISDRLPFGLGTTGLVLMSANPRERRTWRFAVCFYRAGVVTCGKEAYYQYTRHFKSIEEVAEYGLKRFELYRDVALDFDRMVAESGLSGERLFMFSQAVKSYYGSTQLLVEAKANTPIWVVSEGAYRMMNTLDLAVDQLFFEMLKNPWTVRSVLDQYAGGYYYFDDVKSASGEKSAGGIGFAHDMGVANAFSPPGRSSYELRGKRGCYSYMTQEQLVNWILCAGVYFEGARDSAWLERRRQTIEQCLTSMLNRDGADGARRDGVMDLDSCKTGGGAEITTYDNVDTALGRARRSSYLAVKCWAAYLALSKMLGALGMGKQADVASGQADRCADTVLKYRRGDGTIPALLEEGNAAVTLSIVDGLVFPVVMGLFEDAQTVDKHCALVAALKRHFEAALEGGCRFADGGWKMSKTSDNSWLSKTFLCQFISEKIFRHAPDAEADKAHASWLLDPNNAANAFSDQMRAGKICGSAYYPRGVTSVLWLY